MTTKHIVIITILVGGLSIGSTCCIVSKRMSTSSIPLVKDFELERYLGKWYEIARLPHSFEKNLDFVTATYTVRDDGKIKVLNRGYNSKKKSWKDAEGKAWIPDDKMPARLRVSFFWIFASDYKIIALDAESYTYSMVTSKSKKYLWILSRTPKLDQDIYEKLVGMAAEYGFAVEKLYKVEQK